MVNEELSSIAECIWKVGINQYLFWLTRPLTPSHRKMSVSFRLLLSITDLDIHALVRLRLSACECVINNGRHFNSSVVVFFLSPNQDCFSLIQPPIIRFNIQSQAELGSSKLPFQQKLEAKLRSKIKSQMDKALYKAFFTPKSNSPATATSSGSFGRSEPVWRPIPLLSLREASLIAERFQFVSKFPFEFENRGSDQQFVKQSILTTQQYVSVQKQQLQEAEDLLAKLLAIAG